jgi:hypothetical protein
MRQILIELHTPGKQSTDFFILEHPTYGEPQHRWQAVSYTWFRDRELKRAFPNLDGLHKGMNWMEYRNTVKYCSEHHPSRPIKDFLDDMGVDINHVPVCKGVWDFYNKIDYDRKKKKYV